MNDRRILIVEDNPDDESLTQRGLRKAEAEIVVAPERALAPGALALEARTRAIVNSFFAVIALLVAWRVSRGYAEATEALDVDAASPGQAASNA